jgi:hypothetical protein
MDFLDPLTAMIFSHNPKLKKIAIAEESQNWPLDFDFLPVAYANNDWYYRITSQETVSVEGCVWSCQPNLAIPAKINDRSVTRIGLYAFSDDQLKSVTIPSSIVEVDHYAFSRNQLTNLTLPESVENIGYAAFSQNQLTNLNLPSSLHSISGQAFKGNLLTNVTIPASVTSIDNNAFADNQLSFVKFLDGNIIELVHEFLSFQFLVSSLVTTTKEVCLTQPC